MGQIKWSFLLLAILAAICMVGIGISIGLRSMVGAAVFLAALLIVMGTGFRKKKKLHESR